MSINSSSDSETQENASDSSSEEVETARNGHTQKISDYEEQRLKRMEENKARMEAMGLHKMADSLMGSVLMKKKEESKGKRKVMEEDEEYKPEEEETSSSSSEGDADNDSAGGNFSGSRIEKSKKKNSTPNKKVPVKNVSSNSDFVDDDAVMQAIALSVQDSAGFSEVVNHGPSKSSLTHVKDCNVDERKEISHIKEHKGKRKRKISSSNRVQMTEDELILHFFQFDEVGQGSITLRDLRRVAAAHDFLWSDQEMADMVHIFDSNGDGKLSLEDFRGIVGRCNMIQPNGSKVLATQGEENSQR